MGVNSAENTAQQALINELRQLRRDFEDYRNNPQPIGTGSIQFAILTTSLFWSGVTVAAGAHHDFYVDLDWSTYDGLPAWSSQSVMDLFVDVRVDVDDAEHSYPYGVSTRTRVHTWNCLMKSIPWDTSETRAVRRVYIQVENATAASHTYFLRANFWWPRPSLKKV